MPSSSDVPVHILNQANVTRNCWTDAIRTWKQVIAEIKNIFVSQRGIEFGTSGTPVVCLNGATKTRDELSRLSTIVVSVQCPLSWGLRERWCKQGFQYFRKSRIKRINSLSGNQNITRMRCPIHHDLPDSCDSTRSDYITWFPHTRSLALFSFFFFFQQEPQKSFNQE